MPTSSVVSRRVRPVPTLPLRFAMVGVGAVSLRHLDYYLDEFTFRFNRRASASRGKLFYRLIHQALQVDPAPYRSIIAKK
jgi:hypothetical protein